MLAAKGAFGLSPAKTVLRGEETRPTRGGRVGVTVRIRKVDKHSYLNGRRQQYPSLLH